MSGPWQAGGDLTPNPVGDPNGGSRRFSSRLSIAIVIVIVGAMAMPFTSRLPPAVSVMLFLLNGLAATLVVLELLQRRRLKR